MHMEKADSLTRLGKRELGKYAFETQMPKSLAALLADEDDANTIPGVIPKLARLLEHDVNVETAYLCNGSALQVTKLLKEGNHFCGYRNIQMLSLAIGNAHAASPTEHGNLQTKLTIPHIQELVEAAWSKGINAYGRTLTGGIRGTRKHIGTSEAEAVMLHIGIECTGTHFEGQDAWKRLLDHIEAYFAASDGVGRFRIHITACLPIFLQRPGHSLTIVGLQKRREGDRRLLTFDPAWWAPTAALGRVERSGRWSSLRASWVLRQYEKRERYLQRWQEFETLQIDHTRDTTVMVL